MPLNRISPSVTRIRGALNAAQTAISSLPELTSATKANIVALTRQQEAQKIPITDSLKELSGRIRQEEVSNNITTELSNFKPQIVDNVIQRRRGTNSRIESGTDAETRARSRARSKILKGVDPLTAKTAELAKDVIGLGVQKLNLTNRLNSVEGQINALSSKIQSLTKSGDSSAQQLRELQDKMDQYAQQYDDIKVQLERISELYKKRHELWRNIRRKKEEYQKKFWDNYNKLLKILSKFKEIPKKLRFPKLPKLPTLNVRKGNLMMKIRDFADKIKKASQKAAKASLDQAREQAKPKIRDGKKADVFQQQASRARQAFAEVVGRYEGVVAAKNAAVQKVVEAAEYEIRRVRRSVSEAQRQIEVKIDTAAAAHNEKIAKIRRAQEQAKRIRDRAINNLTALANTVSSTVARAQQALNGQLVGSDIQSSPVVANMTVPEKEKTDQLNNNIVEFTNVNSISKFTVGVGKGRTLAVAKQQAATLDKFRRQYPSVRYDTFSRIGNVNGVYVVVTIAYEKPESGRIITPPLQPLAPPPFEPEPESDIGTGNFAPPIESTVTTPQTTTTPSTGVGTTPVTTPTTPVRAPVMPTGASPTPMSANIDTPPANAKKVQAGSRVLIIGDSITAEYYEGQRTGTWARRFKDSRKDLNVEILAIGGKRLGDWMKPQLEQKLRAGQKYSKIVIYGGVNDAFGPATAQGIFNNLQAMVNMAKQSGAQVVVVTGYNTQTDMNIKKIPITKYVKTPEGFIPLKAKYMEYQGLIQTRLTGATVVPPVSVGELGDGVHPYGNQVTTLLNRISQYI